MKFAENIVHFARLLRAAGLPLGPSSVKDALEAAACVDITQRDELYWALHAVLVHRHEEHDLYDYAFGLFFRDPFGRNEALALLLPKVRMPRPADPPAGARRVAEAQAHPRPQGPPRPPPPELELDATWTYAPDEALRTRDFEQMSADELRRAKRAVSAMDLTLHTVVTRRREPHPRGRRLDLRRTIQASMRSFGDAVPLRFRRPVKRPPPLVVLCDISGSMSRYSDVLLHFLHALGSARPRVSTFLFGTRLTNVTRLLRHKDVDLALRGVGGAVPDWAGGTRLRQCLHEFNRWWSRRVLSQGAIVLLITDGLDRDPDPELGLAAEADRLAKSCRRLIWLNPLLRYEGFEPRAQGVRALLPHVDELRPVHNLESLEALARALAQPGRWSERRAPRRQPGAMFGGPRA